MHGMLGVGGTSEDVRHDSRDGSNNHNRPLCGNDKVRENLSRANDSPDIHVIHRLRNININIQHRHRIPYHQSPPNTRSKNTRDVPCPALLTRTSNVPPVRFSMSCFAAVSDAGSVTSMARVSMPADERRDIASRRRAVAKTRWPLRDHSTAREWPIPPSEQPVMRTVLAAMADCADEVEVRCRRNSRLTADRRRRLIFELQCHACGIVVHLHYFIMTFLYPLNIPNAKQTMPQKPINSSSKTCHQASTLNPPTTAIHPNPTLHSIPSLHTRPPPLQITQVLATRQHCHNTRTY